MQSSTLSLLGKLERKALLEVPFEEEDLWFIPKYIPPKKRKQVKPLERTESKSNQEIVDEISADEHKECISICREVSGWVIFLVAFAVCFYTWSTYISFMFRTYAAHLSKSKYPRLIRHTQKL